MQESMGININISAETGGRDVIELRRDWRGRRPERSIGRAREIGDRDLPIQNALAQHAILPPSVDLQTSLHLCHPLNALLEL